MHVLAGNAGSLDKLRQEDLIPLMNRIRNGVIRSHR